MVPALVISVTSSEDIKASIKSQSFGLKGGVKKIENSPVLSPEYIKIIKFLADYYFCSPGLALKTALPNYIFKRKSFAALSSLKQKPSQNLTESKQMVLMGPKEDRRKYYNEFIGDKLKTGRQMLFLVPEASQIEETVGYLAKTHKLDMQKDFAILTGSLSDKELFLNWLKIKNGDINIIVGTRSAIFADFYDLSLIIIDEENNTSYKSWDMYPKYDARTIAIYISKKQGADLVLGDIIPRVETYYAAKRRSFAMIETSPTKTLPKPIIVDMKKEMESGNSSIFGKPTDEIFKNLKKDERVFVYINRKGDSPIVFCRDCAHIAKCKNCATSMVFHKGSGVGGQKKSDILLCHHCGFKTPQPLSCPNCKSTRIKHYGIGIQKVEEEIKKAYPRLNVFAVNKDSAHNSNIEELKESARNADVIVGTFWALKNINGPFDYSIITLADPVFYFPDFRAGEYFLKIIFDALSSTKKDFIIQTYRPSNYLLEEMGKENFSPASALEKEIETRNTLSYPPFSQITKVTSIATSDEAAKKQSLDEAENLKKAIESESKIAEKKIMYEILGPAPAFINRVNNQYYYNIILKDKNKNYKIRKSLLSFLSKNSQIDIDPINTL